MRENFVRKMSFVSDNFKRVRVLTKRSTVMQGLLIVRLSCKSINVILQGILGTNVLISVQYLIVHV